MSTCSYHGGTPTVNMVDTEFMWHAIPPMSAPWSCPIMDKQHGMECIVQPFVVSDLPCNVRRERGQSLVIGGSSLVILEGKECNPL